MGAAVSITRLDLTASELRKRDEIDTLARSLKVFRATEPIDR